MGLGRAPPAHIMLLQMGYPGSFVFEELFAVWASFEETGVGLKIFQDMSSVVESAVKT